MSGAKQPFKYQNRMNKNDYPSQEMDLLQVRMGHLGFPNGKQITEII